MNLKSSHKIPLYIISSPLGQSGIRASDQNKSWSSAHFHSRNGDHGTATILTCLFDRPCLLEAQDLHLKKASRHRQNMWIDILILELDRIQDIWCYIFASFFWTAPRPWNWHMNISRGNRNPYYFVPFRLLHNKPCQFTPFRTISSKSEPKAALLRLPARRCWCINLF